MPLGKNTSLRFLRQGFIPYPNKYCFVTFLVVGPESLFFKNKAYWQNTESVDRTNLYRPSRSYTLRAIRQFFVTTCISRCQSKRPSTLTYYSR